MQILCYKEELQVHNGVFPALQTAKGRCIACCLQRAVKPLDSRLNEVHLKRN